MNKKLKNTKAELKKYVAYKKACSLKNSNDILNSGNKLMYTRIIWSTNYQDVHNILKFFKVLVQVPFTISKTELYI